MFPKLQDRTMPKQEFDNTNRGAMFLQEEKKTENHPDFSGSINIAGVDHWISGWKKVSKDGEYKFISLSLGEAKKSQPTKKRGRTSKEDKDIPF
jgi:hypothetical protein